MTIPEEDRFVGFAGDNAVSSKTFLVENEAAHADIYKLFLTFDDATCNYFMLEQSASDDSIILLWNIKEEHIFKSGVVSAQIKAYSSSGEIWHSSSDFFIVDKSAEYGSYFSNKENSEFLAYERQLIALKEEIENIRAKLPYLGADNYWYIYDNDAGTFIRMALSQSEAMNLVYNVDNVSDIADVPKGQLIRCQGSILLKTGDSADAYTEIARLSSVCPVTRTVAGFPLSADISVSALKAALGIGENG